MGQPLPDEDIEYGTDCASCTGVPPKPWLTGETPRFVYVWIHFLVKCPLANQELPNGQWFRLEQVPLTPCLWQHVGTRWTVDFNADPGGGADAHVGLWDQYNQIYFWGELDPCPREGSVFDNILVDCLGLHGSHHGKATVHWNVLARQIAKDLGVPFEPALFFEVHLTASDIPVYKFCNIAANVNVKAKYNP